MMAAEQNRRDEYLVDNQLFKRNALLLIKKMREMAKTGPKELMDEILHSIFFLGEINDPKFSPKEIFGNDDKLLNELKITYPKPFRLYSSHLPRRSPFSCVLDMVVHLKRQENEDDIRRTLQEIIKELTEIKESTISVSHGNNTDKLVYLKEQENKDDISTILYRLIKELMKNPSDEESISNKIYVYCGNNKDSGFLLKEPENEGKIRPTLQKLSNELISSNEAPYSTIQICRGNSAVKVVHLKRQQNEDEIKTTLEKLVKEFLENISKKAKELMRSPSDKELYSTIYVSCGNSTVSVDHLKGQEIVDEIESTSQKLVEALMGRTLERKKALCSQTICVSHCKNTIKVLHMTGQEIKDELQKIVRMSMENATDDASYSTICVSGGNNTHSVVHLKGKQNEDKITTKLEELIKESMKKPLYFTKICISHGNKVQDFSLQKMDVDGIVEKLQKCVNQKMKAPSIDMFTSCIYRGNNTDSIVYLKGQESGTDIQKALQKIVRELMEKTAHKVFYSTEICVSHGNNTNKDFTLNKKMSEDEIITTLQKLIGEVTKNKESYSTISVSHGNNTVSVVHLKGEENADEIKKTLQELVKNASKKPLYFTITIYCGNSKDSVRHYGVSMSTTGSSAGQIMTYSSCHNFWMEDVGHVMMSYCTLNKTELKNQTFNVSIQLPDNVRCQAFDLSSGEVKIPCRTCHNMFGLDTIQTQVWPCGNCAETESLSKLFGKKKVIVKKNGDWTEENKKRARDNVKNHLIKELINVRFALNIPFYTENEGKKKPRRYSY